MDHLLLNVAPIFLILSYFGLAVLKYAKHKGNFKQTLGEYHFDSFYIKAIPAAGIVYLTMLAFFHFNHNEGMFGLVHLFSFGIFFGYTIRVIRCDFIPKIITINIIKK